MSCVYVKHMYINTWKGVIQEALVTSAFFLNVIVIERLTFLLQYFHCHLCIVSTHYSANVMYL